MKKKLKTLTLACLLSLTTSQTFALNAPEGVRPCCAFGVDLKAAVAGVPVFFFSIGNMLTTEELGKHHYNDNSQGVIKSLFGGGSEKNGLIYTEKGGVIDIAHVRDTADYTFYLYQHILPNLGKDHSLQLENELRTREIKLLANNTKLSEAEKQKISIELAGLLAFQLAQWHEIAQWFGLTSVGSWSEEASAFSPEDLYSNMLGAKIAMEVISSSPNVNVKGFTEEFDKAIIKKLQNMKAVDTDKTAEVITALDGNWWNSNERLPSKWVLQRRDYCLAENLVPNGVKDGKTLSLNTHLSQWGLLRLQASDDEHHFSILPTSLTDKNFWSREDFQALADFAYHHDSQQKINQNVSVRENLKENSCR